ncbi:MAG: helix-turn-helix domain-containing protein [Bacteroidales bacterium]|nr:helix-turn-helix domain-containing protein [Bacteroidales bacterium]
MEITEKQYEYALGKIEELLPLVQEDTPVDDPKAVELVIFSEIAEAYEEKHFPIEKPTLGEIIKLAVEEKGMTQSQLAKEIGVSPSRISDYINNRAEPTLKIAAMLCAVLGIAPAVMLGL